MKPVPARVPVAMATRSITNLSKQRLSFIGDKQIPMFDSTKIAQRKQILYIHAERKFR